MKNKQSGEAGWSIVLPRKPRLSEANENNVFFLLSVAVSILLISLITFLCHDMKRSEASSLLPMKTNNSLQKSNGGLGLGRRPI